MDQNLPHGSSPFGKLRVKKFMTFMLSLSKHAISKKEPPGRPDGSFPFERDPDQ
jgi:hypothetical protein